MISSVLSCNKLHNKENKEDGIERQSSSHNTIDFALVCNKLEQAGRFCFWSLVLISIACLPITILSTAYYYVLRIDVAGVQRTESDERLG